jgi:hypothetical protein
VLHCTTYVPVFFEFRFGHCCIDRLAVILLLHYVSKIFGAPNQLLRSPGCDVNGGLLKCCSQISFMVSGVYLAFY